MNIEIRDKILLLVYNTLKENNGAMTEQLKEKLPDINVKRSLKKLETIGIITKGKVNKIVSNNVTYRWFLK